MYARPSFRILAGMALTSAMAFSQPVIMEVANAASYDPDLAQGGIFVVRGRNLGPQQLSAPPGLPLPAAHAGTRVSVGGLDAFIVYTSATQLAAILPSGAPIGAASLTVTYNGQTSPARSVTIVETEFGIFTQNGAGYGPGAIQNFISPGVVALNGLAKAANPGQTLILYGTGLGPIESGDDVAPGVKPAPVPVELLIGDRRIPAAYAGRAPGFPGLDQINFVLPPDSPEDCYVPVHVLVNGGMSRRASIAVANTGPVCRHPLGLTEVQMRTLDSGGRLTVAAINLDKETINGLTLLELITATFSEMDSSALYRVAATNALGAPQPPAVGTCVVTTYPGPYYEGFLDDGQIGTALEAGSALVLTGSSDRREIPRQAAGKYSLLLSPVAPAGPASVVLRPGTWTVSGLGDRDVGSFSAALAIGEPPVWTNRVSVAPRDRPLTVNWSRGVANTFLTIEGASSTGNRANPVPPPFAVVTFTCAARASDGSFTIPVSVLSKLPPNTRGTLSLRSGAGAQAVVPLTKGGNIDVARITFTLTDGSIVGFQ